MGKKVLNELLIIITRFVFLFSFTEAKRSFCFAMLLHSDISEKWLPCRDPVSLFLGAEMIITQIQLQIQR